METTELFYSSWATRFFWWDNLHHILGNETHVFLFFFRTLGYIITVLWPTPSVYSYQMFLDAWYLCVHMLVCKATVGLPGFREPAFIQLWQIISQHLLMGGLVIIRKAINTPSLFNWFEFMSLNAFTLTLPRFLLSFCPVCIFKTRLFKCLLSGPTVENCVCVWHQTDVNMFIVWLWNRFLQEKVRLNGTSWGFKGLCVWFFKKSARKGHGQNTSEKVAYLHLSQLGLNSRNNCSFAVETWLWCTMNCKVLYNFQNVKENEGPVFMQKKLKLCFKMKENWTDIDLKGRF